MIPVTPAIFLDEREIEESFMRASGPGGQNVNKVETAVQLRFDAKSSPSLPEPVKTRLARIAGSLMTRDGVIVITARRFRTQDANRLDAQQRLVDLIRAAATPDTPRRPTRPTLASRIRRLEEKRRRSTVKDLRGNRSGSDE